MADNTIANAIKFLKGEEKSLPAAKTEGQVYFAYKNVGTAEKPSYTGAIYIDTPIGGTQNRIKMTANADIADKAFNDSAGLNIRDTYLSSLGYTDDGKQTILIKGSGNNQTRIALPIASSTKSGIVTTDAQSFGGTKTFTTINSTNLTITGTSGFSYTGIETATGDKARPVWFAYAGINGKPVVNTNFTYNPATQTLSVANLSGTADKANKDSAGNDIRNTYISDVTISGRTITVTKGSGAKVTLTTQDTDTWRGIQNNLTSDSTTDSLSAAQGKYLKSLIDGKSNNGHNHDDRYYTETEINDKLKTYVPLAGGTMTGNLNFLNNKTGISWARVSDGASILFYAETDSTDNYLDFHVTDDENVNFRWTKTVGSENLTLGTWKREGIRLGQGKFIGNLTGNADTATNATNANKLNTNAGSATRPVYFSNGIPVQCDGTLANSISGNAATASKLQTARTITLAGSVTGSAVFDGSVNVTITTSTNHSHSQYLPLAGGTMSGTSFITWADSGNWDNNNKNVTFPVSRGGLQWYGQSDTVKLFSQETASDNLELVLQFEDDNSNGLSIRNSTGTQTARIAANGNITASSFIGNLNGNANTATALTSSAGSSTQPIYFSGGKPVACTYTLSKSVPADAKFTDTWRPLGTTGDTACAGNDSRLSNARPASDVYAWAKASSKPSYSWGEITGKPSTFTPSSHEHTYLVGSYTGNGGQQNPNYFGLNKVGFLMMNTTVNGNSSYKDWLIMDCYGGSDVGGGVAFGVNRQKLGAYIMRSDASRKAWAEGAELLHTANYTDYTVTKSGLGAYGTWGISISGSAGSVAWGNVTGKPSSFNPSSHTHPYLPLAGGTMNGTSFITWADSGNWDNNNKNVTFPVSRGGLQWYGQSDTVKLFSQETASDNLELVLQFEDDNSNGLSIRNSTGTQTARIAANGNITASSFIGNLSGNASTATNVAWSGVTGKPSTFTPSSHTHPYLPLSGGTMTGTINFTTDKLACNFRPESSGYRTGIMHQSYGSEALVFTTTSAFTSFIFKCGQDPTSMTSNTWANITPSMQIKQQSVYINSLIANTVTPGYNLYVNGTTRCNGTLGVGNGSSAEIDFFPSSASTIGARIKAYSDRIEFVFS